MVIDEHSRHELYGKLEQVLGDQAATTLMEHLPPVGWADVATKQDVRGLETDIQRVETAIQKLETATRRDLGALEQRMDMKLENLENRMLAAFRGELIAQTRAMIFTMAGSVFTAASLTLAAVKLG